MVKTITLNEADSKAIKNLEGRIKWFFVGKKLKSLIMKKGTLKWFAYKIDYNYRYLIKLLDGKVPLSDKKMTGIYSGCYVLDIYDGGLKAFREEFIEQRKIVVKKNKEKEMKKEIEELKKEAKELKEELRKKSGENEDLRIECAKLKKKLKREEEERIFIELKYNFFTGKSLWEKIKRVIKDHFGK